MDRPQTKLLELDSATAFVAKIRDDLLDYYDAVPRLIYRGLGNAKHELIPSALRNDRQSRENLSRIMSMTAWDERYGLEFGVPWQEAAEIETVRRFYQIADKHGLTLPPLHAAIHAALSRSELGGHAEAYPLTSNWPRPELLPLLALVQHFGLPTRLLDWTIDPLVAMYFAAERGFRELETRACTAVNESPGCIAVWKVDSNRLSQIGRRSDLNYPQFEIVHAPRGANPNLTAQKGVFTLSRKDSNMEDLRKPLNEIAAEQFGCGDNAGSACEDLFTLYTLPITESAELLWLLHRQSCDAAAIFPGFSGVATAVSNLARLATHQRNTKQVRNPLERR